MKQCVYLTNDYNEDRLYEIISNSFDELNIIDDLKPGMRVLLKPNLVMAKSPEFPVTTHPSIVRMTAKWFLDHDITDIVVADSPGGLFTKEYLTPVYKTCRMTDAKEFAQLNEDFTFSSVNCPEGFQNHSFNICNYILNADYIVNLPKLKTHSMTGFSGGIKNLFGTIPGLQKPQLHYRWPDITDFSNMLVELSQVIKPNVTLIDAIDAMEGNGPTGGTSHPLNMILASRDFYTQDYFAAKLMGIIPEEIVMIKNSIDKGFVNPDDLELVGDPIPYDALTKFKDPDTKSLNFSTGLPKFLQKPAVYILQHVLKSYPSLEKAKCVGCGKCAESCPAHIINIKNGKAVFQKKNCISCFCCQEMCPMKAIKVKKAL